MTEAEDSPPKPRELRSRKWFDDPTNADMTALYLERYMNFGLSLEELQSGKPIVGIAQTGSDLSPCNRHHLVLAERIREGVRRLGLAIAGELEALSAAAAGGSAPPRLAAP